MNYTFGVATNIGNRPENQDNFFVNGKTKFDGNYLSGSLNPDEINVFAIFDGMGGMNFGGKASQIAGEIFKTEFEKIAKTPPDGFSTELCEIWLKSVSDKIRNEILDNVMGSGTTLTACVICNGYYILFNVGDSPAFLVDGETVTEIGERQNFNGFSNLITHCVGNHEYPSKVGHLSIGKVPSQGKLILCSDGITDCYSNHRFLCEIANHETVETMVSEAGRFSPRADNCALIVINME